MKILAFLQNQWFKDPERVKAMYERWPEKRSEYIRGFLFMGCLTGRRLSEAFGDEICQQHIIWEEVSPQIGGHAASQFPADHAHIRAAIDKHGPDIVVALGKIASDALLGLMVFTDMKALYLICGPHPAARNNPMPELVKIGQQLRDLLK